jgi:hypothetical protein
VSIGSQLCLYRFFLQTIHTYPNNPRVWKALIANEFVGAPIKYTVVEVKMGEHNKTPGMAGLCCSLCVCS